MANILDYLGLERFLDKIKALFVTDVGVDGNQLTWTKNETINNITIPYAIEASKLSTHDYSQDYLTFVALSDGTYTCSKEVQYSLDDGVTWNTLAANAVTTTIAEGTKVLWKAQEFYDGSFAGIPSTIQGNIMSLVYGDDFQNQTVLTKTRQFSYCFTGVAKEVSNLILPATTLTARCYMGMFENTSIKTAPKLPATTLATACYACMFRGCSSLKKTPELPATTLADSCYYQMFMNCTELEEVMDVLPAQTLAQSCYEEMFRYCAKIRQAPILSGLVLQKWCYRSMFQNCYSLTEMPELPSLRLAQECYSYMFQNCHSLLKVHDLSATTLAYGCYSGMFRGCTSLIRAPYLTAETFSDGSVYSQMFSECSNLQFISANFTTDPTSGVGTFTYNWVYQVNPHGVFVKNNNATWNVTGNDGVPTGWKVYTKQEWEEAQWTEVRHYELEAVPTSGSTNPVTSGGVYSALGNKQDTISDLATIRSGAALGATALQEHQDISGKADKVQNATANNVALLDANGNCIDSGKAFTPQGIGALPSSTDVLLANRVWYSGLPKMKTICFKNTLCLTYDETYVLPTNPVGATATNKTLTDLDFDPFGQIYVFPQNGHVQAESYTYYLQPYTAANGVDLRISFNMTSSLTVNRSVYLVMAPQSNGRCKLHTSPISQTLPTTEDGLVYKFLGHAVSANNCCLEFSKPCYYFKDGQIREWTNNSDKQDLLVSGTNIKTVNNTSLLGSGNISIPKGDPGEDGEDAYQPFKGWFDSSSALSSAYPSPQVGDYAYVKGATSTDPVAIYACSVAGTWADSGNTFNPANNQEFASGEGLNTVHIVDGLESSSATDVLSAKQGKVLDEKVAALGPKIDQNKADIEALQDEVVEVSARAGSYDHIPLLGGQPMILFGSGAPVEANVPENWIGFNDGGFEWIGTPSMMGQQYIDTANREKYVSIKNGFTLSWLKV